MSATMRLRCLPLALLMGCLAAAPAAAQRQLGAIQGTISDQTGGVLPGVTVTATNRATGEVRTTVTNESGIYRLGSLDPGTYDVTTELSGFNRAGSKGVTVSVAATLGLNFVLQPGNLTEVVQVTGGSPDIQTERAEVSSVIERQRIIDLPIAGRNPITLATLQAGVIGLPGGTDFLAQEQSMSFNANGQRTSGNNAMVDGLSINGGPWGGTLLLVPNTEAVQEFQIVTNNPSAEFGRNAGAAISLVTRGGTNELRGSAFIFHRNNDLREKTYFETRKGDFNKNDFGGSFGGPVQRDRSFYFASYEGVVEKSGSGAQFTVETEQFRNFVMQTRPNSVAAYLLDTYRPPVYPTENLRDLGSPAPGVRVIGPPDGIPDIGTINYAITNEREGHQINGRFDQVFRNGNDKLRASYYMTRIRPEFTYIREAFDHPYPHRNQFFSVGHTRVVSNDTLNELSFGYVRMHGEADDPTPDSPTISIAGVSGFGVEFWHPITFTQNNFEFKDTLSLNRGRHGLRLGGEFRMAFDTSELHHWERPNYEFQTPLGVTGNAGLLDFADDEAFSERRAVDPSTGLSTFARAEYRSREFAIFAQDNWKVRSNVTLNVGLRYEVFLPPKKANASFSGILLGPGATRQEQVANAKVGAIDSLYATDWNNFGPRLGVAWDVGSNGMTVVRAGGGLSYNRINNTNWSDERLNPPYFANAFASIQDNIPIVYTIGPDYPQNPALGRGLDANGGIQGARIDLRVIDPETALPYSWNWFMGVQRQLPWEMVVEANYIGSAGRKLMSADGPGGEDYNRFSGDLLDGQRNRLNQSFGVVGLAESRIDTNYHAMTLQVNRRFNQGFSLQAAYTLGHAKDHPGSAEDVNDLGRDYGNAGFDVRHNLAMNVIWQIPYSPANAALRAVAGGWQINAITIWRSGTPFNVTCNSAYPTCDFNADGNNGDRVNMPSNLDLGGLSDDDWLAGAFTAADFPLPASGTLGTLPRNYYYGPDYFSTDLSLFKNFALNALGTTGRQTLQVRIEAYNVFNTLNLNNPVTNTAVTNFGRVTSLRTPGGGLPGSRLVQLGLKFTF